MTEGWNAFLWLALGIPAVLGWFAFGLGWLLDPHLVAEVIPLVWAAYAAGAWYVLMLLLLLAIMGGGH